MHVVGELRRRESLRGHCQPVRTGGLLRGQPSESLGSIHADVRGSVRSYTRDGMIELPMPALLTVAELAAARPRRRFVARSRIPAPGEALETCGKEGSSRSQAPSARLISWS